MVRCAGPLVHEDLLELDGERATARRMAFVHTLAQVPALEADVLADVERMASDGLLREVTHEAVDEVAPPVPIERTGADVDLRVRLGGLRRMIGAGAAVVVRVDVEHDERAQTSEVVEEAVEHLVERVVQTTRALHLLLGERLAPHLEAPRRLRALVHALAGAGG